MTRMPGKPCPECGAENRADATTCRLCGALLNTAKAHTPRIEQKILRRTDFMAAARANQRRTRNLVLILTGIGLILGHLVGWNAQAFTGNAPAEADPVWFFSEWGVIAALIVMSFSMIWTAIAFRAGDRIVMRMTGAREISVDEEPQLHNVVEEMALAAGLTKPKIFIIETPAMNAFATGMNPKKAAIGITRGLLDKLTRDELQAVIGHEMGHIVNWDIRYATAVSVMVGLIALVSDSILRSMRYGGTHRGRRSSGRDGGAGAAILFILLIVFAILAPLIAKLVQMAVSRQREFLADATSVRLTRNAQGMISALEKLSQEAEPFKGANRATQHLFIVNPFRNFSEKASALLATHPPLHRRIQRLYNLTDD